MSKTFIQVTFCLFFTHVSWGQNLVPNPSFELYKACPAELKKGEQYLQNWIQPTNGGIDYFNRCSKNCGVPQNSMGHQEAKSGDGYIGLILYYEKNRSYVQVELKEALLAHVTYKVEFSICLTEKSKYAIGNVGTYFTVQKIESKTDDVFETFEYTKPDGTFSFSTGLCRPQFKNSTSNFISDYSYWTTITGSFKASGGEKFMTIGNFSTTAGTPALEATILPVTKQGKKDYAYYFIDDVAVYQTGTKPEEYVTMVVLPEKEILRNTPLKITEAKMESVSKQPLENDQETLAGADKKETLAQKTEEKTTAVEQLPVETPQQETLKATTLVREEEVLSAESIEAEIEEALAQSQPVKDTVRPVFVDEAAVETALQQKEIKQQPVKEQDVQFETAVVESAVETALQRKTIKQEVVKQEVIKAVEVQQQPAPKPTILKYLFFEKNSSRILPESEDELLMLADILSAAGEMHIEIAGHTDESGSEEGNLKLSEQRAQAVVNFMEMLDIDPTRMASKGWGSQKPIADNNTEEGRIKNRRVEFTVATP